jgi:hypothetical protein
LSSFFHLFNTTVKQSNIVVPFNHLFQLLCFLSHLSKHSSWQLFSTPTTCKQQLMSNQDPNSSQPLKTAAAVNSIAECSEGRFSNV